MSTLFLLLLFATTPNSISAEAPHAREIVVHVIEADGSPIVKANIKTCRESEQGQDDRSCETLFSHADGVAVTLESAARYTIEASLEGFLPTTIGPIEVNDWHYPPKELRLLLNIDIME